MLIDLYIAIFVLGAIIGSFLNVVILRLYTGASLSGRSRCFTCAKQLHWYDMLPIVSYLILRGRCRSCKSSFSPQYPVVEVLSGILFLGTFIHVVRIQTDISNAFSISLIPWGAVFFYWIFWSILLVLGVYDVRHRIIPDFFVYFLGALGVFGIFLEAFSHGFTFVHIVQNLAIGPLLALPFFLIWYLSRGRAMGFGDVKLALVLGWFLSLSQALALFVLSFWIGGAIGILFLSISKLRAYPRSPFRLEFLKFWSKKVQFSLLNLASAHQIAHFLSQNLKNSSGKRDRGQALRKNSLSFEKYRVTMKSEIPFAPFLIAGMAVVFFCSVDIFTVIGWFEHAFI